MSSDPSDVGAALRDALDAFEHAGTPEEGMSGLDGDEAQLRKACRLIAAARTLQENDGYHTAVVELSFGAIERSFEFYAIAASGYEVRDFIDHETAYEAVADLGAISPEMRDDFLGLYHENRAPSYYSNRAVTAEEAVSMFELAVAVHDYLRDRPRRHVECLCVGE